MGTIPAAKSPAPQRYTAALWTAVSVSLLKKKYSTLLTIGFYHVFINLIHLKRGGTRYVPPPWFSLLSGPLDKTAGGCFCSRPSMDVNGLYAGPAGWAFTVTLQRILTVLTLPALMTFFVIVSDRRAAGIYRSIQLPAVCRPAHS